VNQQLVQRILANVESAVLGKSEVVRLCTAALLGGGHILLEDAPGLGKTSLARAFARSLGCQFVRMQFTPDLLPSDLLGAAVYRPATGDFEFREGPIFTNILLADEINRTTPRNQSALLEAMSERQVSVEGVTHALPQPFLVLATQNPREFEGTYPLPENQLDRFMMCLSVGYPERRAELEILQRHRTGQPVDALQPVVTVAEVLELQRQVQQVRVEESLAGYMLDVAEKTRNHPELSLGVSTRGVLTWYRAAQALAFMGCWRKVSGSVVVRWCRPLWRLCQSRAEWSVKQLSVVSEGPFGRARLLPSRFLGGIALPSWCSVVPGGGPLA
jgi:MoxR-like ATPase